MDFASVPFQTLLFENAGDEQLLNFLQQLDKQYTNATDEKSRFGTLQILLPIFKAHLIRLDNLNQEEACIDQFLKPWMRASFSQESMVSTESVHKLEETVSFLIARAMLLYPQQSNFGRSTLLIILSQLVTAMETEPDFVDLRPLEFITSNVKEGSQWDQVQTTTVTTALDLECCLDILNLFVRDLQDNESLKVTTEEARVEIEQWMALIFTVTVAMIPCTDVTVRNKVCHDLLPNLFRWQQSSLQNIQLEKQVNWCEVCVASINT
jgi:tRNA guanosine-2'-O-methyltransferase